MLFDDLINWKETTPVQMHHLTVVRMQEMWKKTLFSAMQMPKHHYWHDAVLPGALQNHRDNYMVQESKNK